MNTKTTQSSFRVPFDQEQSTLLFDVLRCLKNSKIDFTLSARNKAAKQHSMCVYRIAKKYALSGEYKPLDHVRIGFNCQQFDVDDGVWFYHSDDICLESAAFLIHLIIRYFDSMMCVKISGAVVHSHLKIDGFSGVGYFITRKKVKRFDIGQWLEEQENIYLKTLTLC
ncbi:MAG: hypothetical protein HAW67_03565 [Endozoicomonadaceae bacterium]|nr:hypothetical protein [Endozoicomonadaceae bacterium]